MRALTVALVGAIFLATLENSWQTATQQLSIHNDICQYFKDDVVLRQPGYCDRSIRCEQSKSVAEDRCQGGDGYNLKTKKCNKVSDVYCSAPCTKSSPTYVNDKKNCEGWYQCDGSKALQSGYCKYNMHFDESKQLCMYPSQTNCVASYNFCNVVPTGIPIPDENNCHQYVMCDDKGNEVSYTCRSGTYFDIATGECIKKSQVSCANYPLPDNVCGTNKVPLRNRFVNDQATCRGYFYCKDTFAYKPDTLPSWGQCPIDMFFDEQLQACSSLTQTHCVEDRCDGILDGVTLSETKGCRHYLVCKNNSTVAELSCSDGMYFDADLKQCTAKKQQYLVCR